VHIDLEFRLKAGEAVRVEDYLRRFPELGDDPTLVLELGLAEFKFRKRRSEPVVVLRTEFLRRFPAQHDELLRQLPRDLQIAGYEVLEELGRGGMGVVYKARHLALDRVVALKKILAGVHAAAADKALFEREAKAFAQLRHDNIVRLFEFAADPT